MINTKHLDPAFERRAMRLERNPGYRVLRAVPPAFSNMPDDGCPPDGKCVALIDLETSGLNPEKDKIIQLALMLVWVDEAGEVIGHFGPIAWFEDPGVPLDPRITMLTSIRSQDLTGKSIPDATVMGMLSRADLLVAHNSSFEIGWLERRYPELKGAAWGCSMRDIDWLMTGFDARAQQHLLAQHGWFAQAHLADVDVWSLFVLLTERRKGWGADERRTHMQRLLAGAQKTTTMVEAQGTPIAKKDLLKARGYRWYPAQRFWAKELDNVLIAHEQAWFYCKGLPAPTLRTITAHERHR
ncbi:exonuclease domain-containing protein [Blastomonas sp.]|uniref:exonuclease domain-containing protein n=1 Tax=Blastomonas sp. TaxID=1909299 RepID=UPI003593AF69